MENNFFSMYGTSLRMAACILIVLNSVAVTSRAQVQDTVGLNKKRFTLCVTGTAIAYSASLAGLYQLWYKDSGQQPFRFFDDNAEWKQVDKLGHFYSTFYLGYTGSRALQWCNMPVKKSDVVGALTGFLVMVPIEIFDGFSDAYGASTGDLLANAAGSTLYLGQKLAWKEVRIYPKFSFHRTSYARLRPNVLGDNAVSEALKDYNGQTYWLSIDMDKFIPFPKWLNLAAGYGAQGMVYAREPQNTARGYHAFRQYYFSLDLDLTSIPTRSKSLRTLIYLLNMIKIPAPALEFSNKKLTFHAFYF